MDEVGGGRASFDPHHRGSIAQKFTMTGRLIMTRFRGAEREIVYTTSSNDSEALSWRFADFPYHEPMTAEERAEIEAVCLTDLRERRAAWRTQLLQRRLVPDLRRRKW